MNEPTTPPPAPAVEPLDEVLRREASFRLQTIHNFRQLDTLIQEQKLKINALEAELGARNTYIHDVNRQLERLQALEEATRQQHATIEQLLARIESARDAERLARDDVAAFMHRLAHTEAELARRTAQSPEARRGWLGTKRDRVAPPLPLPDSPPGDFIYYFHDSPYRLFRGQEFQLRGWALPRDGRAITGLRLWIDTIQHAVQRGLAEPDVITVQGEQPANPQPGFRVNFTAAPGRHQFRLEAQLEKQQWLTLLAIPIWVEAAT